MSKKQCKTKTPKEVETQNSSYVIDNKRYARVTSIINVIRKPGIEGWLSNLTKEESSKISQRSIMIGKIESDI